MNQQISIQIIGVTLHCDCHVVDEPEQSDYPGYFECSVEGIKIGEIDVTELITDHCPNLLKEIEEKCAENART